MNTTPYYPLPLILFFSQSYPLTHLLLRSTSPPLTPRPPLVAAASAPRPPPVAAGADVDDAGSGSRLFAPPTPSHLSLPPSLPPPPGGKSCRPFTAAGHRGWIRPSPCRIRGTPSRISGVAAVACPGACAPGGPGGRRSMAAAAATHPGRCVSGGRGPWAAAPLGAPCLRWLGWPRCCGRHCLSCELI